MLGIRCWMWDVREFRPPPPKFRQSTDATQRRLWWSALSPTRYATPSAAHARKRLGDKPLHPRENAAPRPQRTYDTFARHSRVTVALFAPVGLPLRSFNLQ